MQVGYDWGMIESILARYQNITFKDMLDMPVIKVFDYFEWGVYWMNMEAYFAMIRV